LSSCETHHLSANWELVTPQSKKIATAWDEIAPIAGHQQKIPSTLITSLISVKEMGFAALNPSYGLTID
jgi:hypothetical protein